MKVDCGVLRFTPNDMGLFIKNRDYMARDDSPRTYLPYGKGLRNRIQLPNQQSVWLSQVSNATKATSILRGTNKRYSSIMSPISVPSNLYSFAGALQWLLDRTLNGLKHALISVLMAQTLFHSIKYLCEGRTEALKACHSDGVGTSHNLRTMLMAFKNLLLIVRSAG
jgi:hypothetical protein